ncbi:MAG: hypothetical protein RL007_2593 [Bacteroidota bacterium]|jgi:hypothetical protein
MKKHLHVIIIALLLAIRGSAQTSQDSIATQIGDFILVSNETIYETVQIVEDSTQTIDGGEMEIVSLTEGRAMQNEMSNSALSELLLSLAPNPANGDCQILIENYSGCVSYMVSDVTGRIVYSSNTLVYDSQNSTLPSSLWRAGVYVVNIKIESDTRTVRLVVE